MEGIGKLIFRLIAFLAHAVPGPLRELTVHVCAMCLYALSPRQRGNVADNLSRVGRPASRGLVFGIFKLHTRNVFEMFSSSRWDDGEITDLFECKGKEALDRALAGGKGAILVTGHIGSWELAALYLQTLGYDLHVVAGVQLNKLLTGAVKEAKEKRGIHVVNPDNSYRKLLKALASNGIIALLVDGNIYTGGEDLVFFGATTRVPDGPLKLAKTSGAPIVGGYCRRLGGDRCAIVMEPIMSAGEVETIPEREALNRVYRSVERIIGRNADQWCLFRRFWGGVS